MNFDLIVIGSGPAGQRAALQGAKAGKKVAIVENLPSVGGGCVYFGTLPSKSFRESVYRWSMGSQGALGQEISGGEKDKSIPEMARLLRRKDRVVSQESQVVFDQLTRNGVQIYYGQARFKTKHEIEVKGKKGTDTISGEFIFIAVGSSPSQSIEPTDGRVLLDSNSILELKKVPRSMIVLGAGIIGCEYASMFSMAGTHVYLVDKRHEVLASVDREVVDHLVDRFHHQGMELVLEAETAKIEKTIKRGLMGEKSEVKVHLKDGRVLEAEVALISQGRMGNTADLGLENIGLSTDNRRLIRVDENFQSEISNIYAVGDVIGQPALASTSMEQGRIACCHAFGIHGETSSKMPKNFPYGIYTIPEISMVGETEEELRKRGAEFVAGRARYRELARGQIVGDRWGLLKLLVDRKTFKLLGVHIVGDNATELIHIGQAVMNLDGDLQYFIENVFNYPTLAEAYKTAAFHAVNQIYGTTHTA